MRETFILKSFYGSSLRVIEQANAIIAEMQAQGYTLTVRQLYYQFVSRDYLKNTLNNYKRLASIIDDARKAGLIDWDAIEDRTRYLRRTAVYKNPKDFLAKRVPGYAEDLWANQDAYCEVWIEKDALIGVIERPCHEWRIPYFACRGYASSSELYTAGKRLAWERAKGKHVVIFHLGDHDPSGLDMTRCNDDAIALYGRRMGVDVQRLALNMDQVEHYDPPPNPAKETDSRFGEYCAQYGSESWELDALDPQVIEQLINGAVSGIVDIDQFNADKYAEEQNQKALETLYENWDEIQTSLYARKEQRE